MQTSLAGFLVVKLPFGLTERFKAMTQQGISAPALDTAYVSAGSWYFLAQSAIGSIMGLFRSACGRVEAAGVGHIGCSVLGLCRIVLRSTLPHPSPS